MESASCYLHSLISYEGFRFISSSVVIVLFFSSTTSKRMKVFYLNVVLTLFVGEGNYSFIIDMNCGSPIDKCTVLYITSVDIQIRGWVSS